PGDRHVPTAGAIADTRCRYMPVAAGLDGASAGQVLRLETIVVVAAPKLQAGSVLPYADASFEQGVAGWSVASGAATIARTSPWGTSAFEGSYALAVTSTTASASVVRSARFPVTEGVNWRCHPLVHPDERHWS